MTKSLVALAALVTLTGVADAAAAPRVGHETPVTATDLIRRIGNTSPQIAVDPRDSRLLALANRIDGPQFGCSLQLSGDSGKTWLPAQPVASLPPGVDRCYAPQIDFDGDGQLLYLFVGLQGTGNRPVGVFLTSSSDRGRTFGQPRQVLGEQRYQVRMAMDRPRGRIHLVWLEARGEPSLGGLPTVANPIMAAHSDDHGRSFSTPVQVSDASRALAVAPAVALGADGRVHVLFYDLGEDRIDYQGLEGPTWAGTWSLVLATSLDAGGHFSRDVVVDDGIVPPSRVMLIFTMPPASLAVHGTTLYVAWHDARNLDWDVFIRRSDDSGSTWGSPVRVNDDPLRNSRHQYLPRLAVAPGGRLDVIFYDRRDDRQNIGTAVYYSTSEDRGRTFSRNIPLTSISFSPRIGAQYLNKSAEGLTEFGSWLGLYSERSSAVAAWTDTRNTRRGVSAQDIFATRVVLPARGRSTGLGFGIFAALMGLVIAAANIVALRRRRRLARSASQRDGLDD